MYLELPRGVNPNHTLDDPFTKPRVIQLTCSSKKKRYFYQIYKPYDNFNS